MKQFKIKSFCKINLSLKVLKILNNGYHNISSLITFCDMHDVIKIRKIQGVKDKIFFSGKFKQGINKKYNTVNKVLSLLRKENLLKKQAFEINTKKNIPHGSGLGGGSSNAANLLNFFKLKMHLQINKIQTYKIAKNIGFDVPISLEKKNTLLTGKKGQMIRFNSRLGFNLLIAYPNINCSTKKIYHYNKNFSHKNNRFSFYIKNKKKIINFLKNETNDLEETVIKFYPQVRRLINFINKQNGCYFSRITGSGSACIGIFSNMKTAIYAQKLVKLKFPKYWCVVSKTI